MARDRRVLYFYLHRSTFVLKDIEILAESFEVLPFQFDISRKWLIPWSFLKQTVFILRNGRSKSVCMSQFAGFHSLLPSLLKGLFGMKSIIVLGGTDCVSFPSINYGNFNRRFLGQFTAWSMKLADLLLPVHETLIRYNYTYQPADGVSQGYLAHHPEVFTPAQVVYNGYDCDKWKESVTPRESGSFVTIGANLTGKYLKLKGIDLILEVAHRFPMNKFYIIGGSSMVVSTYPENVILFDVVPNEELNQILASKEFYLQLSLSEGFPNALCEAMLSGCIPVVSNVGAMPMIVGNNGFILYQKSVDSLASLLEEAIALNSADRLRLSSKARLSVKDRFPIERRKAELLRAVELV